MYRKMTATEPPGLAAFRRYEEVRPRLPAAPPMPDAPTRHADLSALLERYEVFVLDGFGVLNVGASAIPGAAERIAAIRRAGRRVVVLTNAATYPPAIGLEKYRALGFDFSAAEIVSSRDVALAAIGDGLLAHRVSAGARTSRRTGTPLWKGVLVRGSQCSALVSSLMAGPEATRSPSAVGCRRP